MTVAEATALVLREGHPGKDVPEDAVFMMLHLRYDLSRSDAAHEQMQHLVEAVNVLDEAFSNQTAISRQLAGAIYTLGAEAYLAIQENRNGRRILSSREEDDVMGLFLATEAFFFDAKDDKEAE